MKKTAKSRSACCYKSCIRILWFQRTQREQTLPVAIITWTPIFIAALKAFAVLLVIMLLLFINVPTIPINWKESVTKGSAKLTSLQDASLTAKRSTHRWKTVLRSILLADSQSENSLLDYHQETSLSEAEIGQKFTQPKQTPATIKVRHG